MDILDEGFGEATTYPVESLENMVEVTPDRSSQYPRAAVRNRAATSAILTSDPDKLVETYRLMLQEDSEGQSVTHDMAKKQLEDQSKAGGMKHVLALLGDPTIPFEQKKQLMTFVQTKGFAEDPSVTLQTKALVDDSKGEDKRGEAARISTADVMNEMHEERVNRQKLMNGFGATLPDASVAHLTADIAAAEVMPFGRNKIMADVAEQVNKQAGVPTSMGQWVWNFLRPGSTKKGLQERLNAIPPKDREPFTRSLLAGSKDGAAVFGDENYFAQFSTAQTLLSEDIMGKGSAWTENMMTVLDAFWVGSEIRAAKLAVTGPKIAEEFSKARRPGSNNPGVSDAEYVEKAKWELVGDPYNPNQIPSGTKRLTGPTKVADDIKRIEVNSVVRREHPAAPYNVIEQVNPAKARELHETILASASDEVAEALTGVNRDQALANNIYPQVATESGIVLNKVNQSVKDVLTNTGATRYTANEFEQAVANTTRDFRNATGLEINDAMTTFRVDGDHLAIDAHYSTVGGSFANAEEAIAQAMYALRRYGIREDEVVVMKRQGMDYVPSTAGKQVLTPDVAPVKKGFVRLLRAESPTTKFHDVFDASKLQEFKRPEGWKGQRYTDSEKVAKYYKQSYGRDAKIHYIDVPEDIAKARKIGDAEYIIDPTTLNPGDYIVKVKTKHAINDTQVDNWNPLDVKRNWTDRISQLGSEDKGNLSGWFMDPGSMLHPTLTGSASVVTDQAINLENILLKPIKELRSEIGSFKAPRQKAIEEYLVEANNKGLKLDPYDLHTRGFNPQEIEAVKKWKDIWDGHYYLENYDLVRTLNSQGFELFENANTKLFARPLLQKNKDIGKVYDPSTDSVVSLSKADMDALYDKGGHYATLRRPADINGDIVEHMIVRNTPKEYLRKLRDTDTVLNYRNGYYTVNYKAPKFVDEIVTDAAGKETRRTVAVAGNTADAEMFINSQQAASGNKHVMREDSRGFKKDGDGYWDVNEARGRIAQRVRGKPLTQATGVNTLGTGSFVENPMESAVRAAKSLAGRSISRPMLETAKRRFVDQYKDFLPSDNMGGKRYPMNRSELTDHGSHTSSKIADARTTYGYINFLEDGYINTADEVFKGGMNALADMLGKYHLSGPERAARTIGDVALTNVAKGTVFQAYIAMSLPMRQWIVQSHQVTRMFAYNPAGFLNMGWEKRMAGYLQVASGLGNASPFSKDFHKFVEDSGMVAGVDRNSLVRGLGLSMADSSSKFKRTAGTAWSLPQTVGFDVGEKVNQLGHLAAVHEKWTRAGKDLALDKTARDLALTEARALSYDLNKAGELTFTQSSAAGILQFLQMPQKAMLQMFNRKLPLDVRLRLQAWDLVMWGAPTGTIAYMVGAAGGNGGDILPDDDEHREMFVDGVEAWALNEMFTRMDDSGDKTRIDLSALSPNNMDGWARMFMATMDDGPMGMLAASPAGQLFAVDGVNNSRRNGRIPQAMITMSRFFQTLADDETMTPTDFKDVMNDVAKITSGWSAVSNAMIMLESRKKQDTMGVVVDSSVTGPEVGAAFLGFGTKSTKELYEISKTISKQKKAHEEDVMSRYRDIIQYTKEAASQDKVDVKHMQRVHSVLMSTFKDPEDLKMVRNQWMKDLPGKEAALFQSLLKASGMPGMNLEDSIKTWPVEQAQKDLMMQRLKMFKELREKNEEGK